MKRLFFTSMLLAFITAGFAQSTDSADKQIVLEPAGTPVMQLEEDAHNFGKIRQGESVQHTFTFVNVGDAPLVIEKVAVGCGCTTPTYSEEPVMPGQEGKIVVEFNSTGKTGMQAKTVRVHYNNMEQSPQLITIRCVVRR